MASKIFGVIVGFLLILGGIFYFFKDSITISYTAVCAIGLGLAFNALYFKKKKGWAILPGIYLLYLGIAFAFFKNSPIYNYILTSVFFLAPGSIFTILYYSGDRKKPLLSFGIILLATGICVILSGLFDFNNINIFLLCLGAGFMINYILGGDYGNKTTLILGVVLCLLSIRNFLNVNGYTDIIISMILVITGFAVIVRALLDK